MVTIGIGTGLLTKHIGTVMSIDIPTPRGSIDYKCTICPMCPLSDNSAKTGQVAPLESS